MYQFMSTIMFSILFLFTEYFENEVYIKINTSINESITI